MEPPAPTPLGYLEAADYGLGFRMRHTGPAAGVDSARLHHHHTKRVWEEEPTRRTSSAYSPKVAAYEMVPAGVNSKRTVHLTNHDQFADRVEKHNTRSKPGFDFPLEFKPPDEATKAAKRGYVTAPQRHKPYLEDVGSRRRIVGPRGQNLLAHTTVATEEPKGAPARTLRRQYNSQPLQDQSWSRSNSSSDLSSRLSPVAGLNESTRIALKSKVHLSGSNEQCYHVAGTEDLLPASTRQYMKADLPASPEHQMEWTKKNLPWFARDYLSKKAPNPQLDVSTEMSACLHVPEAVFVGVAARAEAAEAARSSQATAKSVPPAPRRSGGSGEARSASTARGSGRSHSARGERPRQRQSTGGSRASERQSTQRDRSAGARQDTRRSGLGRRPKSAR